MNPLSLQFAILLSILFFMHAPTGFAHEKWTDQVSLSIGASMGFAPVLTFGEIDDAGAVFGLSGDLHYQKIIGQLDYVYVLPGSVDNESFISGMGVYGSIGYKFTASENVHIPVMVTGGVSHIEYGTVNDFFDVSPQFGLTISPNYMLNQRMSVFGALRYMKGQKGSVQSDPIDVTTITFGLRLTLF